MSDLSEPIKLIISGFNVFHNVCWDNNKLNNKTISNDQVLYYDHFPTRGFLRLHGAAQTFTVSSAILQTNFNPSFTFISNLTN